MRFFILNDTQALDSSPSTLCMRIQMFVDWPLENYGIVQVYERALEFDYWQYNLHLALESAWCVFQTEPHS